MAEARDRSEWDKAAAICMDIRNSAFGSKGQTKMADVHPYLMRRRQPARKLDREKSAALLDKVFGVANA